MIFRRVVVAALATFGAALLSSEMAAAQFGAPGLGGPPGGAGRSGPKKDPNAPVTHAASGAGDDTIPKPTTSEPALPANPLEVSPEVRARIGSDQDTDTEKGRGASAGRSFRILPPYFEERQGTYRFRTVFPFWVDRTQPGDQSSLYGLLYHRRRSVETSADVVFPVYWRWREGLDRTTIAGPVMVHRSPTASDTFVAPLFFQGTRADGGYLNIPPLLTFLKNDKYGGRSIVGPGYCFWRGGTSCNPNTADDIDYGVAPFYFAGKNDQSRYEFALPLLHYYRYKELDQSWLNVWGPVIAAHSPEHEAFHVAPFFFRLWGKNENHVTIPPLLFHSGYKNNERLLITPAFLLGRGEKNEKTFVTWGYARYRGRTSLDMVTPLYWRYEDPDAHLQRHFLFPFLYTSRGPRESDTALFPFFAHFQRFGLKESYWITPFVQQTTSITGWDFNVHPLVYLGRDRQHSHTVVAPFFWDFATPTSRTTIGFPFYWRFAEDRTVSQVALNTYYRQKRLARGLDWEFHFFPLFSYGETPNGHWWNLLYGLTGYSRRGAATAMRLFWIPIPLSEDVSR